MPPKDKAAQEKRAKIAEDKTFGMKNKNKSKTVQKYIKSISANASGAMGKSNKEIDDEHKKKEKKAADVQNAALMAGLFNKQVDHKGRAFDPVAKKAAKQAAEEAEAAGKKLKEEMKKIIVEGLANSIRLTDPKGVRMSELGGHPIIHALKDKYADTFKVISLLLFIKANKEIFWVDDEESSNPFVRCTDDVDAETAPDDRAIEEILEERRKALPPGGTPVTLLSFTAWRQKKINEKFEANQEEIKAAQSKDKGNKHAGLSGRDLFTFDASLFQDDAEAAEADEMNERASTSSEDEAPRAVPEGGPKAAGAAAAVGDEGSDEGSDFDLEDAQEKVFAEAKPKEDPSPEVAVISDAKLFLEGDDALPDDLDDLDSD